MSLMDVKETAKYLSVSCSLVYKLAARGELPSIKIGDCVRFTEDAVENYINRDKHTVPQYAMPHYPPAPKIEGPYMLGV
jgi:excisionase family DNA binding protein